MANKYLIFDNFGGDVEVLGESMEIDDSTVFVHDAAGQLVHFHRLVVSVSVTPVEAS